MAVVVVSAGVLLWLWPRHQVKKWRRKRLNQQKLADIDNSARQLVVQTAGALVAAGALALAFVQLSSTQDQSDRTLERTRQGQETDRFSGAVALLSEKGLDSLPAPCRRGLCA